MSDVIFVWEAWLQAFCNLQSIHNGMVYAEEPSTNVGATTDEWRELATTDEWRELRELSLYANATLSSIRQGEWLMNQWMVMDR